MSNPLVSTVLQNQDQAVRIRDAPLSSSLSFFHVLESLDWFRMNIESSSPTERLAVFKEGVSAEEVPGEEGIVLGAALAGLATGRGRGLGREDIAVPKRNEGVGK